MQSPSDTKPSAGYWKRIIVDGHVFHTFVTVTYPRFSAAEAEELKQEQAAKLSKEISNDRH